MTFLNRFNIASGLLITALMLAWPDGRLSYIALETWGGMHIPWGVWPGLCLLLALLLFVLPAGRPLVYAFVGAAMLFLTFGGAVALSVGPGVLIGAAWTAMLGPMRIALDLKADLQARGKWGRGRRDLSWR